MGLLTSDPGPPFEDRKYIAHLRREAEAAESRARDWSTYAKNCRETADKLTASLQQEQNPS